MCCLSYINIVLGYPQKNVQVVVKGATQWLSCQCACCKLIVLFLNSQRSFNSTVVTQSAKNSEVVLFLRFESMISKGIVSSRPLQG